MQAAARQAGLSAHVIRAWERRYGAIDPSRSGTGRRLFSEEDVERLTLLRRATLAGHSIGAVARLPTRELRTLLNSASRTPVSEAADNGAPFRGAGMGAVQRMDVGALEASLQRAVVLLGHQGLLRNVVAPMAEQIGQLWHDGAMTAAHEHFFTAAVKSFLGQLTRQFTPPASAPVLVCCTPINQHHELGAYLAGVAGGHLGWRVIYLGPALPAAEIAGVAEQQAARAVALSLVYPQDDTALPDELRLLRKFLPATTSIIVGGRVAEAYRAVLDEIGAVLVASIDSFFHQLDTLRRSPRATTL